MSSIVMVRTIKIILTNCSPLSSNGSQKPPQRQGSITTAKPAAVPSLLSRSGSLGSVSKTTSQPQKDRVIATTTVQKKVEEDQPRKKLKSSPPSQQEIEEMMLARDLEAIYEEADKLPTKVDDDKRKLPLWMTDEEAYKSILCNYYES
jgi:hypothetical protein